ncbi:MAG TPA: tyrosine-type recombinase/integrase [Candidatus Baltobacteraceae bacterium]|nr:tyrosine-type recombinase/integrase [Candidatus Dormibacteraeota bacterium]HVA27073.1 tyrosine-type recombinase/integrase [Candidatus Baltobacteraceae bacterium]
MPLERGRSLGFRKIDIDNATWIARMRPEEGGSKYEYRALGTASREFDYEAARKKALEWFGSRDAGIGGEVTTVADACREYVVELRRAKGTASAHDAEKRFERTVYKAHIGSVHLDKVRTPMLSHWRDGLRQSKGSRPGLSPASVNRTATALKAALNLAVANARVDLRAAQNWRNLKPLKGASKRRTLFLDLGQRRALLGAAKGAVRDLIEAAALTGARAGELANGTRGQFDSRTKSMTFIGKTGSRTVPLSPAATALFVRLARGKLPGAFLLTRDDGKPWAHSDWDELVREAANAAMLPAGTCLYTLRHSWVTSALVAGLATLDVARLCGTSVTMIERHYGHLVDASARERLASVKFL